MKYSACLRKLSLILVVSALSLTASPAFSQGKGKAKGKQKVETKENHGRQEGGLPWGLGSYMEKNEGQLPSGLQKKKDEDNSLTRGLDEGGKSLTTKSKGKKGHK